MRKENTFLLLVSTTSVAPDDENDENQCVNVISLGMSVCARILKCTQTEQSQFVRIQPHLFHIANHLIYFTHMVQFVVSVAVHCST